MLSEKEGELSERVVGSAGLEKCEEGTAHVTVVEDQQNQHEMGRTPLCWRKRVRDCVYLDVTYCIEIQVCNTMRFRYEYDKTNYLTDAI